MADNGKSFLVDTTRCIGCRACQVACKQWNNLPAEETVPRNRGSFENPPDLSPTQWLLVHFHEAVREDGSLAWNFVRNSCRHCVDAPCRQKALDQGAVLVDESTGAVLFTEKARDEIFALIQRACPHGIPRQGPDGALFKCRMCVDRVHNGALPDCVQTCPTGGLSFGDRADILAIADARLAEVREQSKDATLLDRNEARVLILLGDRESHYRMQAAG